MKKECFLRLLMEENLLRNIIEYHSNYKGEYKK